MNKLKPCPFCGSKALRDTDGSGEILIWCTNRECFPLGEFGTEPDMWNHRAGEDKIAGIDLTGELK